MVTSSRVIVEFRLIATTSWVTLDKVLAQKYRKRTFKFRKNTSDTERWVEPTTPTTPTIPTSVLDKKIVTKRISSFFFTFFGEKFFLHWSRDRRHFVHRQCDHLLHLQQRRRRRRRLQRRWRQPKTTNGLILFLEIQCTFLNELFILSRDQKIRCALKTWMDSSSSWNGRKVANAR